MNNKKEITMFAHILDLGRNATNGTEEDMIEDVTFIICSLCNVTKKQHKNEKAAYRARQKALKCLELQDFNCVEALDVYDQCFKEESHKEEEIITNDSLFYTIGA